MHVSLWWPLLTRCVLPTPASCPSCDRIHAPCLNSLLSPLYSYNVPSLSTFHNTQGMLQQAFFSTYLTHLQFVCQHLLYPRPLTGAHTRTRTPTGPAKDAALLQTMMRSHNLVIASVLPRTPGDPHCSRAHPPHSLARPPRSLACLPPWAIATILLMNLY